MLFAIFHCHNIFAKERSYFCKVVLCFFAHLIAFMSELNLDYIIRTFLNTYTCNIFLHSLCSNPISFFPLKHNLLLSETNNLKNVNLTFKAFHWIWSNTKMQENAFQNPAKRNISKTTFLKIVKFAELKKNKTFPVSFKFESVTL